MSKTTIWELVPGEINGNVLMFLSGNELIGCVCVSLASGYGGVPVKHAIPITSDTPQ